MFVDELLITVQSGAGGDGRSAFRREKFVPMGGPAGGDGGRGGDVVLVADPQLTTFGDMEHERVVRAQDGGGGGTQNRHGADAPDRVVGVPPGTTVRDADTGEVLVDLATAGMRWVAAPGGAGGKGNNRFATATDQAPTRTTPGEPSVRRRLRLELRLLADAGLVGLPNAGKSTMLSRLSRATPKIASYPFTTLAPHLGLVELANYRRFVLADLPGLVAGAHEGRGLGHQFLRHVERTRLLVHLVDLFPTEGDPLAAYRTVRAEIEAYGHGLAARPEIVVGTKGDLAPPGEAAAAARRLGEALGCEVLLVSAVTGAGLEALVATIARRLGALAAEPPVAAAPPAPARPPAPAAPRALAPAALAPASAASDVPPRPAARVPTAKPARKATPARKVKAARKATAARKPTATSRRDGGAREARRTAARKPAKTSAVARGRTSKGPATPARKASARPASKKRPARGARRTPRR
ncbi:MAG: GTPase ObgE [Planctomycetes bacterium]|nr:GTPase ObgE [Planctomycetota bacterium]